MLIAAPRNRANTGNDTPGGDSRPCIFVANSTPRKTGTAMPTPKHQHRYFMDAMEGVPPLAKCSDLHRASLLPTFSDVV